MSKTESDGLWERLKAALAARSLLPEGQPTALEIASRADAGLGGDSIGRFVRDYYLPLRYGAGAALGAIEAEAIVAGIEALPGGPKRADPVAPTADLKAAAPEFGGDRRPKAEAAPESRQSFAQTARKERVEDKRPGANRSPQPPKPAATRSATVESDQASKLASLERQTPAPKTSDAPRRLLSSERASVLALLVAVAAIPILYVKEKRDIQATLETVRPIVRSALQAEERARDAKARALEAAEKGRAAGMCLARGYGVCTLRDGSSYAGERPYGYGVSRSADGTIRAGYWPKDSASGYGVVTFADGTIKEGNWNNGAMNDCLSVTTSPDGGRQVGLSDWDYENLDCQPPPDISFGPIFTVANGGSSGSLHYRFAGFKVDAAKKVSLWANDAVTEATPEDIDALR